MDEPGLKLDDIRISLGRRTLVELTRAVRPGETLTVMGPSGSGKSSMLAFIGGFLDPAFRATGKVTCDGVDLLSLPAEQRRAGILFQDALLFPHMSVLSNLLFAIPQDVRPASERRELAQAALDRVDLSGFGARDPDTLSGGQKTRVALARVLLSRPRMLLLDEPFSKLDAALRAAMRELVFSSARDNGLPVVLVTHDEADAEAAGGDVVRIGEA
ncbi:MAG: ATP-binding cassette domain-containing protein [Mesorhizobium sp.]